MLELNCPSCGAKVPFQSTISLLAVCPYCRSLVMRTEMKVEDLGKVADLQPDGSPIQLGTRGTYGTVRFSVLGRVQMRYAQGFWNEWFLGLEDGRQGWLGEAQGLYAVSFQKTPKSRLPERKELKIDRRLELAGEVWQVDDLHEAAYLTAEGELPYRVPLGQSAEFADLAGEGRRFATIDYSEDEPLLFQGEYVDFDDLRFEGLKAVEGW